MPAHPLFLWHNSVHEEWADEQLVFFFFAWEPRYSRTTACTDIQALVEEFDIRAYQIYEVTAPYDVVVRAWVPGRVRLPQLKKRLEKANDHGRRTAHVLAVTAIVHHWIWAPKRRGPIGEMDRPSEEELVTGRPARERDHLNEIMTAATTDLRKLDRLTQKLIRDYGEANLIRRPLFRDGIRFMVLIKVTQDNRDVDNLERRLVEVLDRSAGVIRDPSLYRLDDYNHPYLIFGHVAERPGQFHAINDRVVSQINDLVGVGSARTYTSFFPMKGFLGITDHLRGANDAMAPEPHIEELLQQAEGQRLEIKATAFTDVDQWIKGSGPAMRSPRPVVDPKNHAINSLMRAIASLLNSDGGHIVIGAVEKSTYANFARFNELPSADRAGTHRIYGLESVNGLQSDILPAGSLDQFLRTLREIIEYRFSPVPSTQWLRIRPATLAGRTMCVIDVQVPDEFFDVRVADKRTKQLDEKFIVRVEAKGTELKGPARAKHERVTSRALRTRK